MATTTAALEPKAPSRLRAWIFAILAIVLVLLIAAAGVIYWKARRALPQVDGTISVPGLSAPVEVIRDAQGVPHITAATVDDLFFAQGYVTAQDRLWQMDVTRRSAAGELSEVLGPKLLKHDREQRYLQIRYMAERGAAVLNARDRTFLEDYANGVNAFISSHRDRLPLEFALLGYQPKPWRVADSLMIGENMSEVLNTQFDIELKREKVVNQLCAATGDTTLNPVSQKGAGRQDPAKDNSCRQLIADLYPNHSWRDHPPGTESKEDEEPANEDEKHAARTPESLVAGSNAATVLWHECEACQPGSNNWVVSGEHTVSGKPLLSNDMHLPHQLPGIWYEAHLHSGSFNVAGVTLPGLPFVIVGHNQRIAWGFTNLGPDVQDLFIEKMNADLQVQTPQGFVTPEHHFETIHVKGGKDVSFDVLVTRHGPIITPMIPAEPRPLALQWTIYDPANAGVPFFDVNSAGNWQEFRAAFSKFPGPSQNVVYADVDGHIGYQATGRIPIRASGDGLTPVSGADSAHDWIGYVPFEKLPSVYDPPSGIIATANGRITPDGYPYLLANNWFPPYRTERIYRVLRNGQKFSPADMLALQTDIYSDIDRFFAEHFVEAIDHSRNPSARLREAADIMRAWDGRMSKDSAAASLEYYSRRALLRMLLAPRLGAKHELYSWGFSTVALEEIVDHHPARWLPPGIHDYDELLVAPVEQALKQAPRNLKMWYWGNQYMLEIQHPVLGSIPVLKWFSGTGRHPQSGSGYTVKQIGLTFGPSERMTVDFSNLDGSTLNIVTGQSGDFLSPHYKDQFPAWYGDTTFVFPFSDSAVEKAKQHELVLKPGK